VSTQRERIEVAREDDHRVARAFEHENQGSERMRRWTVTAEADDAAWLRNDPEYNAGTIWEIRGGEGRAWTS
jgi:hypothetical protein